MFEWLSSLPHWFQIIIILIILGFIISFFIMLFVRGGKVRTRKFALDFSRQNESIISPHITCPYAKDIVHLLNETQKILMEKYEVKNRYILKQQMIFAEDKSIHIAGMMHKTYIDILQDMKITSPTSHESFHFYKTIVELIRVKCIDRLRIIFRENQFAELSESEFNDYIDSKTDYFTNLVTNSLNDYYFYTKVVDRDTLFHANMIRISEYKNILREIFTRARKIALEGYHTIDLLDKKLESLIKCTLDI